MPIDGYLLQKAAVEVFIMDICFHFSWKTPKREMVESCRGYMFNILRNCQTLFKVVAPFKIPTSHVRHFQFLSYYCLYLVSPDFFLLYSNRCEAVSHYGFNFHFPNMMSSYYWFERSLPWEFPGRNTGVGYHSLLQRIVPTQGLNLGLLHCRQILCHLSHKENPYMF